MAWWSYPPLDRSPRVPRTRHRRRRRQRDAVFYRLYHDFTAKHVSRFVRREKNLLFSPDHSFFSLSISLSLAFRKKRCPLCGLPKKNASVGLGRSRKEGRAFGRPRSLWVGVYRKEFFSIISPLKELDESESFFCVSEESKMSHSFSFPPTHLLHPLKKK